MDHQNRSDKHPGLWQQRGKDGGVSGDNRPPPSHLRAHVPQRVEYSGAATLPGPLALSPVGSIMPGKSYVLHLGWLNVAKQKRNAKPNLYFTAAFRYRTLSLPLLSSVMSLLWLFIYKLMPLMFIWVPRSLQFSMTYITLK